MSDVESQSQQTRSLRPRLKLKELDAFYCCLKSNILNGECVIFYSYHLSVLSHLPLTFYAAVLLGSITGLARPSVRPSVRLSVPYGLLSA